MTRAYMSVETGNPNLPVRRMSRSERLACVRTLGPCWSRWETYPVQRASGPGQSAL
jgi:hypothetical protein